MKKKIRNFAQNYWWLMIVSAGTLIFSLTMILSYGQSIWFDEGYSILLAKKGFGELLALTAVDAHPPFYYSLLKIWGIVFGFSEFSLRSLSAVFAAGAVMIALHLTRKLFGMRVAMLSLPFIILAPFLLRYGYEIRMYSLAMFIGVAGTYALVVARETKRLLWWIMYAMLVALGMYTLYMTAVIWLAHLVWQLVLSIRNRQPLADWKWAFAYLGAFAFFIPYLPTFLHQLTNSALPGIGNAITLTTMVDLISVFTLFTPQWDIDGWLSLLLLAMIVSLVAVGLKVYAKKPADQPVNEGLLLYTCLAVVPIVFFILISLPSSESIFVNRYLAHVSIWLYLLVGVLIALIWRSTMKDKLIKYGAVLTIALFGLGVLNLMDRGNFVFERAQTPMNQQIRNDLAKSGFSNCTEGVTIVADDPYTYIDNVYYFDQCNYKFYATDQVERKGGYAPLHNSQERLSEPSQVTTPSLVHFHWNDPKFEVDDRYRLIKQTQYDKQWVDIYKIIEE